MAKARTTRQQSDEHESFVVELYRFDNARRSRSSGAAWDDSIDVVTDTLAIECESTEGKGHSRLLALWKEVVEKAANGRRPALAIRFRDPEFGRHVDLLVTSIHDDVELRERCG